VKISVPTYGYTELYLSDYKPLVDFFNYNHLGVYEVSTIVSNIISMLSSHLNFEAKFISKQANMIAHTFERAATLWA